MAACFYGVLFLTSRLPKSPTTTVRSYIFLCMLQVSIRTLAPGGSALLGVTFRCLCFSLKSEIRLAANQQPPDSSIGGRSYFTSLAHKT